MGVKELRRVTAEMMLVIAKKTEGKMGGIPESLIDEVRAQSIVEVEVESLIQNSPGQAKPR